MIVEHMSPMQNLISILCIAILFAVRRYLFFDHDDEELAEAHRENNKKI
jgi:hypothetical protein